MYIRMENVNSHLENNDGFEWKPRMMFVSFESIESQPEMYCRLNC